MDSQTAQAFAPREAACETEAAKEATKEHNGD
jgi:hypothetical protein